MKPKIKKKGKEKNPEMVRLINNQGKELYLPGNLTIEKMFQLGIDKIKISPKDAPRPKSSKWYWCKP
jgi:hypothetical protein